MSLPADLLAQARLLATKEPSRPKQSSLRRSVSASYYALFHLLVDAASRRMVSGRGRTPLRHCLSRAFDHASMKKVALQFASRNLSRKLDPGLNGEPLQTELVSVASAFVSLQQHRHEADYDMARRFTRLETVSITQKVERTFSDWDTVRNSVQADTFLVGLLAFDRMRG